VRSSTAGALLAVVTGVTWGGQFVVGKSALAHVDAFHLTTIRYAVAAALLLVLLAAVEGPGALRLEGRGWALFRLGTLGFAGFNLLAYEGLQHARPQSAALITSLGPLLTALVLWQRTRVRPSRTTFAALAVALAGVALVVGRGNPASIVEGSVGWGDALVLAGVLSFVVYTVGAAEHRDLSPLRYTALTAALGWISIAVATEAGTLLGRLPSPGDGAYTSAWEQIAYISLLGAVVAVLAWNTAVARLGAQNASLFGNLVPVTTFAIEIARGYRPGAAELAGAGVTIGALVGANVLARRSARAAPEAVPVECPEVDPIAA
jgi:drug/metabolite transporter (DMT)-like permease